MISEDLNDNQSVHNPVQRGKIRVIFMGKHKPITNIGYRFKAVNIETIEGITDKQGYTKTLIGDSTMLERQSELISYVALDSNSIAVSLEVKKDDDTWKEIGNFQLEAGKEKEIIAQVETIVLPFTLVPADR